MKKIFAIILCSVAMFSFMDVANAETIRNLKKKLDVLLAEAKTKKETIKKTETEIYITRTTINKIYSDMEFISSEIVRLQDEMILLAEDIKGKDKQIKELIKAYQTTTEGSFYLEYIFGAETIEDFIYRYSLTEQISRYNNELILQMDKKIEEDKKKNEEMKVKTTELEVQQGKLKVQLDSLGTKKEILQEQEQSVEDEIKSAQEVIKMYENAGCDIDEDINVCANRLLPPDTRFYRPTVSSYITSNFGNRINPLNGSYISFHSGIDMSSSTKTNTPILAVANGVVVKILYTNCGGNQVYVHHNINGRKYTSAYVHLSKVLVAEGQIVSKETKIGMMGGVPRIGDNCTTGVHLHLSISNGLYFKDYWTYNDYKAKLIDPRQVINFPVINGPTWYDRITRY